MPSSTQNNSHLQQAEYPLLTTGEHVRKESRQPQGKRLKQYFLYAFLVVMLCVVVRSYLTDLLLPIAVEAGNFERVEIILTVGARPRGQLIEAVKYAVASDESSRPGRLQIISALVKRCFPDGKMRYEYEQRFSGINEGRRLNQELVQALKIALKRQDAQLLDAILAGGLQPDRLSINDSQLIFETIKTGSLDLLKTLHAHGADLNFRTAAGATPFVAAVCQRNMEIARYLVQQGVETADADACNDMLEDVELSVLKEAGVFREALARAEQNDAQAQDALGTLYRHGQGVAQDDAEAFKWYSKAAEQGYARARNNLGQMYFSGWGVEQNMEKAFQWFQIAAEQGFATAQFNLGLMYLDAYGVAQNNAEAVKWFQKAAMQGHAEAQNNLAMMLKHGQGVAQSDTQAVKWFQKSTEQRNSSAQYNLGLMYYEGRGVAQSDTKAVKWFREAAEQGHEFAQYNLGAMYSDGLGVAQDNMTAYMWVNLAIARSNPDASYYPAFVAVRTKLARQLDDSQIAHAKQLAQDWERRFQVAEIGGQPHDNRPPPTGFR